MKTLSIFIIFLTTLAYGVTKTQSDADISTALVGSWTNAPSDNLRVYDKVTYYADGSSVEFVWFINQPESTMLRIDTKWAVTNQVLIITSVKSSDVQKVPVGVELRDRIISISPDQFVFEMEGGYGNLEKKRYTEIRLKTEIKSTSKSNITTP